MKKFLSIMVLTLMSFSLIGCSTGGSGGGMGSSTLAGVALDSADMAVVEASLLANRVDALETASLPAASIDVAPDQITGVMASFQYRGRNYQGGKMGQGKNARRGTGQCQVSLDGTIASSARLWVASEACQVERTAAGGYLITRANGSTITIEKPADDSGRVTLTVNGQTWAAYFGTDGTTPLVTLKNDRSGKTLIINEDDSGALTITAEDGNSFRGYWNSDGTLEATEEGHGRQYRYRGGRNV